MSDIAPVPGFPMPAFESGEIPGRAAREAPGATASGAPPSPGQVVSGSYSPGLGNAGGGGGLPLSVQGTQGPNVALTNAGPTPIVTTPALAVPAGAYVLVMLSAEFEASVSAQTIHVVIVDDLGSYSDQSDPTIAPSTTLGVTRCVRFGPYAAAGDRTFKVTAQPMTDATPSAINTNLIAVLVKSTVNSSTVTLPSPGGGTLPGPGGTSPGGVVK